MLLRLYASAVGFLFPCTSTLDTYTHLHSCIELGDVLVCTNCGAGISLKLETSEQATTPISDGYHVLVTSFIAI